MAFLFPKLSPEEKKMLMEEQLKKLDQEQNAPEKEVKRMDVNVVGTRIVFLGRRKI